MRRFIAQSLFLTLVALALVAGNSALAEESLVSTMRNVNAVAEARGFYLTPASDRSGGTGSGSLAPVQAFEIIRPGMGALTIARLYTSCTCVQLVSPKRTFARGERAVLELHNVRPTPINGQIYAIYVQVTSPIRATLRYDTFVQSSQFVIKPLPEIVPEPEQPAPVEVAATPGETPGVTNESPSVLDKVEDEAKAAAEAAMEATGAAEEATSQAVEAELNSAEASVKGAESTAGEALEDAAVKADAVASEAADAAEQALEAAESAVRAAEEAVKAEHPAAGSSQSAAPGESQTEKEAPASSGAVDQRISMITLGVSDLTRSRKFYEALGWKPVAKSKYDGIIFFQLNGQALSLYPLADLVRDQNLTGQETRPGGITLGINVHGKDEVMRTYQAFLDAGGKSLKEPEEMPWGSVTCYVADPDGYPWEISWVPQMQVDAKGELWIE